jgi:phospholipase/lecithinase/hemolysin
MIRSALGKVLKTAILFLALTQVDPAMAGATDRRFVVFGDSLSDPGNAFILLRDLEVPPFSSLVPDAPYARGALHFSNGPTWVEQLSLREHALPSAGPALLLPGVLSNYAVGGARARQEGPFDLTTQVGLFVHDFSSFAPGDALYIVFSGGNDLRDALGALSADPSGTASAVIVAGALSSVRDNLLTLYAAGARRFLVANAPDLALVPAVRLLGLPAQGAAHLLSLQFNTGLEAILQGLEAGLGLHVVRLDVFGILTQVVADPSAAGLVDVTQPCIALDTVRSAYCAKPGTFLFWDGIHPTVAGHRILADRAAAALAADGALVISP